MNTLKVCVILCNKMFDFFIKIIKLIPFDTTPHKIIFNPKLIIPVSVINEHIKYVMQQLIIVAIMYPHKDKQYLILLSSGKIYLNIFTTNKLIKK